MPELQEVFLKKAEPAADVPPAPMKKAAAKAPAKAAAKTAVKAAAKIAAKKPARRRAG